MIVRDFPIDLSSSYPIERLGPMDETLFFDIETTGLSADTSFLYLIGCVYYKDSSFHLIQWFSESPSEELKILTLFFEFMKSFKLLIHFNGTGFDLPYITKKCKQYELSYSFDTIQSLDLYKKVTLLKPILKLENYKQKSIERFLKISREDMASGGELIEVYQSYLGKKHIATLKQSRTPESAQESMKEAESLLYLLLLHNEDDIKGLVYICSIFYYLNIFDSDLHLEQVYVKDHYLMIEFILPFSLPQNLTVNKDLIQLHISQNRGQLIIETFEGELKYYYPNYKEYFYLPAEDNAIHQSLAQFVEKEFKQKAKPATAYTRKNGLFVPVFDKILSPIFQKSHLDKIAYLEVHTDFLLQENNILLYVKHILQQLKA